MIRLREFGPAKTTPRKGKSMEKGARAQGLLEYALIILLVALIVILVLVLLAPPIGNVYSNIISNL